MKRARRDSHRGPGPRQPSRRALAGRSDEQLVELVLGGNDDAFEVLFERHVTDSLWYAREVLGSWDEAEEAVSHSFAAAHAYLETRGRETEFAPWLQTILCNHCLSMLQARTPGPERPAENANVVDLGEWRLRRKLMGVSLPIPATFGLRESLLAACGIGGGAAAVAGGAPLVSGALVKLAVVAVLAGGVGVAGDLSQPDRPASAAGGVELRAMVAPRAAAASSSTHRSASTRKLAGPDRSKAAPRQPVSAPPALPAAPAPVEQAPVTRRLPVVGTVGGSPGVVSGGGAPPPPVALHETPSVTTALGDAREHLGDVVGVDVPAIEDLAEPGPLGSPELPKAVEEGLEAVVSDPAAGVLAVLDVTASPAVE